MYCPVLHSVHIDSSLHLFVAWSRACVFRDFACLYTCLWKQACMRACIVCVHLCYTTLYPGAKWVERTWNAVKGLSPTIIYTYIYDHNLGGQP